MQHDGQNSPFPGPRPFTAAERKNFFGRSGELRDLVSLVIAHPLAVLHGPTGSGKTSLIHAGLVPELEAAGFEVLPVARLGGLLPPGTDASRLRNVYTYSVLLHWAREDERDVDLLSGYTLAAYLKGILARDPDSKKPLAIVFDQVEDMFFTYPEQYHHREAFLRELAEVLQGERGFGLSGRPLRVLLAIRDDRLADLERHAHVVPDALRVRFALDDLHLAEAIEAIREPARGVISQADAEQLARALAHRRVRLPNGKLALIASEVIDPMHLQVACDELWARGGRPGAMGKDLDPDEALTRFVGAAVRRASKGWGGERKIRRWLEDRMLTPDGGRATARRGANATGGLVNEMVENLERERIIRAEERLGNKWYELAHDRLIVPLQRSNAAWSEEQRRGRRAWRVVLWALVLAGVAVGAVVVGRIAARWWEGVQGEKDELNSKLAVEGEERDRLTRQRGLAWGELEGLYRQVTLERLDAEVLGLSRDVIALQAAIVDMGRYRPAAQDLESEGETLLNFAQTGISLAGMTARVQQASAQTSALIADVAATRKANSSPELKDMFDRLRDGAEELEPELERLRRALNTASGRFAAYNAQLSTALETFEGRPGTSPSARVREGSMGHWRAGYRAWLSGDLVNAKARFAKAVERDASNPSAHDGLARVAWAEGKVDDAAAEYRRALAERKDFSPSLTGIAEVYLHQNHIADAERCARQALHYQPDYAAAFLVLSEVRRRLVSEPLGEIHDDNPCGTTHHSPGPATASGPATPVLTPPPSTPAAAAPIEPEPTPAPEPANVEPTPAPEPAKVEPTPAPVQPKPPAPKKKPPAKKKAPDEAGSEPAAPVDRTPPPIEISPP
ncbi:MAG: tetratricopeptide repeat protein [Myxococcales bacterium]|nr:tetratricopeptide repeat protein [Myxococcales bacterium]